jgi:hypothetical protein
MTILDDTLALIKRQQHPISVQFIVPVSEHEASLILSHRKELAQAIFRSRDIPYRRNNELKGKIAANLQFGPPELWREQAAVHPPQISGTVLSIVEGIIYGSSPLPVSRHGGIRARKRPHANASARYSGFRKRPPNHKGGNKG